jgi:hypothetical protein
MSPVKMIEMGLLLTIFILLPKIGKEHDTIIPELDTHAFPLPFK